MASFDNDKTTTTNGLECSSNTDIFKLDVHIRFSRKSPPENSSTRQGGGQLERHFARDEILISEFILHTYVCNIDDYYDVNFGIGGRVGCTNFQTCVKATPSPTIW